MIKTYSQMQRTEKYAHGWIFVYDLSGYGFESRYSQ